MTVVCVDGVHQTGARSRLTQSRGLTSAAAGLSASMPASPGGPSVSASPAASWSPWASCVLVLRPALASLASRVLNL